MLHFTKNENLHWMKELSQIVYLGFVPLTFFYVPGAQGLGLLLLLVSEKNDLAWKAVTPPIVGES